MSGLLDSGKRARIVMQVKIPIGMPDEEIPSWIMNNLSPTLFFSTHIEKTDVVIGTLQPGPMIGGG